MNYLLDTNAVVAVLKDDPGSVRQRLKRVSGRGNAVATSSVVLFELWYGIARSARRNENTERLRVFLSGAVSVIPFEEDDAIAAGELRAQLETVGKPIGPYDLLIAAQALRMRATLVTANVAEFARVRGLAWQDWSRSRS